MAESPKHFNFPYLLDDKELLANINSSKYHCKVCNMDLNSREQYDQHLQGQKHLKSQKILFFDDRQVEEGSPNSNLNNMLEVSRGGASLDNLADEDTRGGGVSLDEESLGDDPSKPCTVCKIPNFTSPIHMKDHYEGKKHLNRVKIMIANNNSNSLPIITATSSTNWVHCNVCNVPLNTPEQLRIHCDSTRHKIKELDSSLLNRRSSSMEPSFDIEERRSLSDGNETDGGGGDVSNQTGQKDLSNAMSATPKKTEKEWNLSKRLFPSSSPVVAETATPPQNSKGEYDSNKKILNNLENPCNNINSSFLPDSSESSSGLQPNDTFPKYSQAAEADSDSVTMKKVLNSVQESNNNPPSDNDITAMSSPSPSPCPPPDNNNSLPLILTRRRTNNLSLPEETNQSNNDSVNSDSIFEEGKEEEDNISNDQIANIIDGIKNLSVTSSPISENQRSISDASNLTNKLKAPSASGGPRGSQQARSASRTSPPKSEEEDGLSSFLEMYIEKIEKNGKILCYYCNLCESQLTQGAVKSHIEGLNHRQKMMTRPVPERDLPPVNETCEDPTTEAFELTEFCPRSYQVELFEKCHTSDSIIFLPTGTGKTLCASMLIAYMLKQNPKRSVLFLVDKVLLVFQQKRFIEEQLKTKTFVRFDVEDNARLVERELNIACVCGGGTVGTRDKPLWMHDIVISTAAYCSNMMDQSVLRWSDFSLVVVDEAHHCVKNHPFKKIFSKQHSVLEKSKRPKILGLTASPAGQETLEGTIRLLAGLTEDLGEAKIAIVEGAVAVLNKFKSNARLEVEMLPPSNEEMSFNFHLKEYLMQCLLYLKQKSNICDYIDFISSADEIELNAERLDDLQSAYDEVTIDKDKAAGMSLLWHVKKITSALAVSLEMGIPLALEELKSLSDRSNNLDGFSKALELGLPCQRIKEMCEKYTKIMEDPLWEQDEIMSTVHFLIHKITDLRDKEAKNKNAIVLVLVKQRATAMRLSAIMQKSNAMKQRKLSCVSLVGHGAGTSTGMNVNDQKRTLEEIKDNQHQVIIATSVAEEGIDLPECSLVITMKPPTSVTTLVQMRGRARKKNSLFLTICGNEKQKLKLMNLLKQEEVMERATRKLVDFYKKNLI